MVCSVMTVIMTGFGKIYSVTRKEDRNNGVYGMSKESENLPENKQKLA